jgi:hypothetical protein
MRRLHRWVPCINVSHQTYLSFDGVILQLPLLLFPITSPGPGTPPLNSSFDVLEVDGQFSLIPFSQSMPPGPNAGYPTLIYVGVYVSTFDSVAGAYETRDPSFSDDMVTEWLFWKSFPYNFPSTGDPLSAQTLRVDLSSIRPFKLAAGQLLSLAVNAILAPASVGNEMVVSPSVRMRISGMFP